MTKYLRISTTAVYVALIVALFANVAIIYLIIDDRVDILCIGKPASER